MADPDAFTCACCGGQFTKTRTDADAMDEALDLYPAADLADGVDIVCDNCFNDVIAWARANASELLRGAM